MSELRNQFSLARREYESFRYPGDLASILAISPKRDPWKLPWAPVGIAAAALILVGLGWFARVFDPPAVETAVATDSSGLVRLEWTGDEHRLTPVLAIKTPAMGMNGTPASPLLAEARQPVVSCGQFIVDVGRDLAHQAGALFESM